MLKEHSTIIRRLAVGLDVGLLTAAFFLAFRIRFRHWPAGPGELFYYGWATLVFGVVCLCTLYRGGLYSRLRYLSPGTITGRLLIAFGTGALGTAATLFLAHATGYSRLLFFGFILLSLLLISASRLGSKLVLEKLRLRGYNYRTVLLAGWGAGCKRLEELFKPGNPYGIRISETVDLRRETAESFVHRLTDGIVDEVYFAIPREDERPELVDPFLERAERAGKTCKFVLGIGEKPGRRCHFTRLAGLPLIVSLPAGPDPDQLFIKRLVDLAGALIGLGLNLILFPVIAPAIRIDSPGPVFFCQTRIGRNGRPFKIYKYRSMYQDAGARKRELETRNEISGAAFKITDDPRITRVGRFLRRTSLDELPQFLNVLTGEMSLVGTRPPTPDEVRQYGLDHYRRLSIRPGITGLWQVSGRNRITDFDEIVKLDTRYIEQWSLALDGKILLKTLTAAWNGR